MWQFRLRIAISVYFTFTLPSSASPLGYHTIPYSFNNVAVYATYNNTVQYCDSVAEWLACWTHTQKGLGSNRSATLSGNSLRQTVHTHRASVHQAPKLAPTLLKVARVTAGLAESTGSLPSGL